MKKSSSKISTENRATNENNNSTQPTSNIAEEHKRENDSEDRNISSSQNNQEALAIANLQRVMFDGQDEYRDATGNHMEDKNRQERLEKPILTGGATTLANTFVNSAEAVERIIKQQASDHISFKEAAKTISRMDILNANRRMMMGGTLGQALIDHFGKPKKE